jgi:hypothetical protein
VSLLLKKYMKMKHLTKAQRLELTLSTQSKEILIGLLLGDLHVEKQKTSVNARLKFIQGSIHKEYLFELYGLFRAYCSAVPKLHSLVPDKVTGKIHSRVTFNTLSLPCFNDIYDLFYLEGKKIVPQNIAELLTALGMAYWICDDGSLDKSTQRVILCTESFSIEGVTLLVNVLNTKWNLECYKNKTNNGGYRIMIPRRSLPILQSLIGQHMPDMMRHKIGL